MASAITDKGVTTALDATFETMAYNISKIANGYIGNISATLSSATSAGWVNYAYVDISSKYPNYKELTIDNICVQIPQTATIQESSVTMNYSYDSTTGIITISSSRYWLRYASSLKVKVAIVE